MFGGAPSRDTSVSPESHQVEPGATGRQVIPHPSTSHSPSPRSRKHRSQSPSPSLGPSHPVSGQGHPSSRASSPSKHHTSSPPRTHPLRQCLAVCRGCRSFVATLFTVAIIVYVYTRRTRSDPTVWSKGDVPVYTDACFAENEPYQHAALLEDYLRLHPDEPCTAMVDLGHAVQHVALCSMEQPEVVYHILNPRYASMAPLFRQETSYLVPHPGVFEVDPLLGIPERETSAPVLRHLVDSPEPLHPLLHSRPMDHDRITTDNGPVTKDPGSETNDATAGIPEHDHLASHIPIVTQGIATHTCRRWDAVAMSYERMASPRDYVRKLHVFTGRHAYCLQFYADLFAQRDRCTTPE